MAESALFGQEGGISQEVTSERGDLHRPKEGMNGEQEPDREKLAEECREYFDYYLQRLSTPYKNMVRWNKLFLNEVKDRRGPDEDWRAFLPSSYPWSTIKTLAASYNDLILGQTPIIKPHAPSYKNEAGRVNIERLFSYIFRRNRFEGELKRSIEEHGIQGVAVRKNTLVEKSVTSFVYPEERETAAFQEAIANALTNGVQPPDMADREAFEDWRKQANEVMGLGIPEMPVPGPRQMRQYFGPGFEHTSIFDLVFDPEIFYFNDQPMIIQRSIKPLSWLMDRTGLEDEKIFDPVAVEEGKGGVPDTQVNQWQAQIAALYGISSDIASNPRLKSAVEIWECWYPEAKRFNYRVVLNRKIVINKNMDNPYPFKHPYIFMRNNTVSGNALGISEFKVVERSFYELSTIRSLRLDALMLSVIPMFVRARDGKSSQEESFVKPGRVFSSNRPEAFKQIIQAGLDPSIYKEDDEIRNEIMDSTGTQPVLRGATAAPRVPTGNVEKAAQQSFTRIKDRVLEFEGEINPFISNSLGIMYCFWPAEQIVRVGGEPKMNPFVTYTRDDLFEAIESDFEFHGARTAFDQEALIQATKEWFTILAGVAPTGMIPSYKMDAHAKLVSTMILKDAADEIFMTEEEMMEQQQAQQEEEAAQQVDNAGAEQGGAGAEAGAEAQGAPA